MKLKRMMVMATAMLMISASLFSVQASDTVTAVPVLISIQQMEVRGEFVAYEEGLLTLLMNDEEVMVAVDPDGEAEQVKEVTEATYGDQFAKLQAGTLIDLMVTVGETTDYILESLVAIHQRFESVGQPELIKEKVMNQQFDGIEMTFNEETITVDVKPQTIDGKVMLPLRAVAEALGYEVTWNNETKSVELLKGAQWTSIKIGENAYFRNRMAPAPLSLAPVIVDSRTLVPAEFVTEILQYGIQVQEGVLKIYDEPFTTLTGYVSSIDVLENYSMVYVAPRQGEDVELWEQTVLIVSEDTIINREPYYVGDLINGVHMPVMTMSIPGQTGAVVIY